MYNRRFFASELGQAALVSIAAMMAFIVIAGIMPGATTTDTVLVSTSLVELA